MVPYFVYIVMLSYGALFYVVLFVMLSYGTLFSQLLPSSKKNCYAWQAFLPILGKLFWHISYNNVFQNFNLCIEEPIGIRY